MTTYLYLAEIIVAVFLVLLIMLQARGGGLGGIFGQWGMPTFRTRRGIERTLFRVTVALIVVFVGLSIVAVLA